MDQLIIIGVTVLLIGSSVIGTIVRRIMRSVEAKRMEMRGREQREQDRTGPAPVPRATHSAAGAVSRISAVTRVDPPPAYSGVARDGFTELHDRSGSDVLVEKTTGGLDRIRALSPLKQAIIWSELISRPVSERSE